MKKLFLSLMLAIAGISVFAQSDNNEVGEPKPSTTTVVMTAGGGYMARNGRNLTLDGRELTDAEVMELVGAENYETYLGAKKQITTGRVFTGIFIGATAATVVCLVTAIAKKDLDLAYTSYIPAIAADVSCPLMCIFNGIGKGRMNWVADEYNRNQRTAMSYSLMPSVMRVQDNTGLGLTFSFSF